MTLSERSLGFLMACTTAFFWSVLAVALKFTLQFAETGTIVWFRMLVASLVLLGLFAVRHPQQLVILKRPPTLALLAGALLAFNYFGFMKGIELTSATNAQIMIQTAPLSLALIGVFYFKERLNGWQWAGVALAILGFVCFYWSQFQLPDEIHADYVGGNLWVWLAALAWALFGTFQKILTKKGWSPQQINLVLYLVSALALAPTTNWQDFVQLSVAGWLLLIALGLNTLVAYGSLGEALKRIPASYVSMIICMNPLVTILILKIIEWTGVGWVTPEPLDLTSYIGAFGVVFGVALALSFQPKSKAST